MCADVFTVEKRSEVMSLIRGKGNRRTELALISVFRKAKIVGWRRNRVLFGKPDFVFIDRRLAIFVDGCFWHSCAQHSKVPVGNAEFWSKKLHANKTRDKVVNRTLRHQGWTVLRIWEHELRRKNIPQTVKRIWRYLKKCENPLGKSGLA